MTTPADRQAASQAGPTATGRSFGIAAGESIAVLATLDTKGDEARFVSERIRRAGWRPLVVDLSLAGSSDVGCEISADDIALAVGSPLEALRRRDKAELMRAVAAGALELLRMREGRLAGVIGLGGGQGTWLAGSILRELPLGLPKVLLTSIAARAPLHVGASDIVVVPSVTDLAGLNSISEGILEAAAGAVTGMASARRASRRRPPAGLIGVTMFGVTTPGAVAVRRRLEAAGHEVAMFHANGNGGRVLELLIRDGVITGVVDYTTTELIDEVVGGIATAGPDRLDAAGELGLPQVCVPGALDVVNFAARDSVPARFRRRRLHEHTPVATLMRASASELTDVAEVMARKLNRATGPVRVVIPTRGLSALDVEGGPFFDPVADRVLAERLEALLDPRIPVVRLDRHINDPEFAEGAADQFLELWNNRKGRNRGASSVEPSA